MEGEGGEGGEGGGEGRVGGGLGGYLALSQFFLCQISFKTSELLQVARRDLQRVSMGRSSRAPSMHRVYVAPRHSRPLLFQRVIHARARCGVPAPCTSGGRGSGYKQREGGCNNRSSCLTSRRPRRHSCTRAGHEGVRG